MLKNKNPRENVKKNLLEVSLSPILIKGNNVTNGMQRLKHGEINNYQYSFITNID